MESKQPIPRELVKEFVLCSHGNASRVRQLLADEPGLVNAVWDWGGGDWETALGAAAHVGNREIALFLLSNGARLDLYTAAMLGELDVVEAALRRFPEMRAVSGTHGFSLLEHAKAGGEAAEPVVRFLEEQGASA